MSSAGFRGFAERAKRVLAVSGANVDGLLESARRFPAYVRDLRRYQQTCKDPRFSAKLGTLLPALADRDDHAIDTHYFLQDLWAARRVFERRPAQHLDIGSRIDGFVAHLLVFMPVTVVDIRSIRVSTPGLSFVQEDATSLASFADRGVASVSCLHAAEHFGLGRYGDAIDPGAAFTLMRSLARVLAPGGSLYFSVPVGRERVEFNAHRVFDPRTILSAFEDLRLVSFDALDDAGQLLKDADPRHAATFDYGCGMFELMR